MKIFPIRAWLKLPILTYSKKFRRQWVNPDLPRSDGLSHHLLDSKVLGHQVGFVVWTPESFDARGPTRYPVIYFLHGSGGSESSDAVDFSSLIAEGIRSGILPPVICVFPNGGRSHYGGKVAKYITAELIPLIDREYPTRSDCMSRIVAGFSMGGAGAVQLSVFYPQLFSASVSWGGGMWQGAASLLKAAKRGAESLRKNNFLALLINGDHDRPDAFSALAERFEALTIDHETVILPDTPHNLGLYYERAGSLTLEFLGSRLRQEN